MTSFLAILVAFATFFFNAHSFRITRSGTAVVEIGGVQKIMTRSTSCKASNWKWSEDMQLNSCKCCLVKHSLKKDGTFSYENNSISVCKEDQKCTVEIIDNIRQSFGLEEKSSFPTILESLVNEVSVVKAADVTNADYITTVLRILKKKGKIKDFDDNYASYAVGGGGAQTLQLFIVKDVKGDVKYIVKELKKSIGETSNIGIIKKSSLKEFILNPDGPNAFTGMPFIALNVIFSTYRDPNGKLHTVAVLPAAPGEQLIKILQSFADNYGAFSVATPSDKDMEKRINYMKQKKDLPKIMYDFGHQLGKFHLFGMTEKNGHLTGFSTAVHGDMHSNNIFIDTKNHNAVTFIDAETMALALNKPRYVGADLRKFYIFAAINRKKHQYAKGDIPTEEWHQLIIKPFLKGYIDAYAKSEDDKINAEKLKDVFVILKNSLLKTFGTKEKLIDVLLVPTVFGKDPLKLLKYQTKYMKPLLKELVQEYKEKMMPNSAN
ncbi:MAG: hypothetical protein WCG05_01595 [Alphaproteobacteria bacterium]